MRSLTALLILLAGVPGLADDRSECEARLRALGGLCLRYAAEHGGRGPARLSDLYYSAYTRDLSLFACPGRPIPISARERIDDLAGYALCPVGEGADPRPMVRDLSPENHGGAGIHVFLGDGTVHFEPHEGAAPEGVAEPEVFTAVGARIYLGLRATAVAAGDPRLAGTPFATADLVEEVQTGSVAAQWGLRAGDIVLSFRGAAAGAGKSLAELVAGCDPDDRVPVDLLRDGKPMARVAAVGDLPILVAGKTPGTAPAVVPRVTSLTVGPNVPPDARRIDCRLAYDGAAADCHLRVEWSRGTEPVALCVAGVRGSGRLVAALVAPEGKRFPAGSWSVAVYAGAALLGRAEFAIE